MTIRSSPAADAVLQQALDRRRQSGLYRSLPLSSDRLTDLCSNDYLGFAKDTALSNIDTHTGGSTGSRLISGNTELAEDTERMIAAYHHAEAALIFNTGYMANVGLFSSLGDRHATFLYDEHIHASVIDGMRLSLAKHYKFRHNDTGDLEKKLQAASGTIYVAVESVYSMDGDTADLERIAALCSTYGAALIVDEAHAAGIFGNKGEGLVSAMQLEDAVFARVFTFGKALGQHGAAVCGSHTLREFLINHARAFIYTTGLPEHSYTSIRNAYNALPSADRQRLKDLTGYFRSCAEASPGISLSFIVNDSPIQGIVVPGNEHARALAAHLQASGFFVKAILSPTVPANTERIRICLHTFNNREQIDALFTALKSYSL